MKCLKCKKIIDEGDLFCGFCGINQQKYAKYLEKISKKIHKERDREYRNKVSSAENKLRQLEMARGNEINKIANSRWETVGGNLLSFNVTEGKVKINGSTYIFSDIKGAEIIKQDSFRTVTNTTSTNSGKTKKHASIGGGLLGAAVAGPLGAVVGGTALGKTTSKGNSNTVTNSNQIPTCYHIGVNVDLNGFTTEIIILNQSIDQGNYIYNNKVQIAQTIVDKLHSLSKMEVPQKFLKPEEEESVLKYDGQIKEAKKEVERVKADKPNYDIPEDYL